MCGSVKHEKRAKNIGALVVVTKEIGGAAHIGKWTGFARNESLLTTWLNHVVMSLMKADTYNEHGVDFTIPTGMGIRTAIITKPIRPEQNEGDVLIITRPAFTALEIKAHHRHPMIVRI